MHHSMKLYSRHREIFIRAYIFFGKWTRIPVIGRLVRAVANAYGAGVTRAYLLNYAEAREIVANARGIALSPCTCRAVFKNCDHPVQAELMIGASRHAFIHERPAAHREISKDEALDILKKCHEGGLMHTIVKCRDEYYAICNCCTCCCVPYRLQKNYGIGKALSRNNNIVREFKKLLPQ
ncbi:MAG: ferredoxin-like protein [Chloroflexi bacterium]|nr:ferredoxin-like protein [Chloroflexota bacterium]